MEIERKWAMPNRWTFQIEPIRELIEEEMDDGLWIDPFAGKSDLADVTNDLNPEFDTDYNEEATEFLKRFDDGEVDGVLFDPPYSSYQVKKVYEDIGKEVNDEHYTQGHVNNAFWYNPKREVARVLKGGGKCISFGWNSNGVGKKYGFEIERILLVCHGARHNDTICVVEMKKQSTLD